MQAHEGITRSPEEISDAFDDAWARGDVDALISLYAHDATIESPLIPVLMPEKREGICRGHDEIRALVRALLGRGAEWGKHEPPAFRGNMIYVEYRRMTPDRTQLDYVAVFETEDGRITSLRAYWGWHALAKLSAGRGQQQPMTFAASG